MAVSAFGVEDSRLDDISKAIPGLQRVGTRLGGKVGGMSGARTGAKVGSTLDTGLARVKTGATKVGERWARLTPVQQGLALGGGVGGVGVGTGFALGGRKKS